MTYLTMVTYLTKKVLAISDIHSGEVTSVMPSEVVTEKYHYKPNSLQKKLLKKWEEMCDLGTFDALIVNGDSIQGPNYKEKGLGCWTTDIGLQVDCAAELLDMIKVRKRGMKVGVQGTVYHTGSNMTSDKLVMDKIGGIFDDDMKLTFPHEKVSFHLAHKVGVSSSAWMYRSTPIAREMLMAELSKSEFGEMQVILRGHAHYYWLCGSGSHKGIILPAWQGRNIYVKRLSLAYNPHLGFVVLKIHNDGYVEIDDRHIFKLKGDDIITEVKVE